MNNFSLIITSFFILADEASDICDRHTEDKKSAPPFHDDSLAMTLPQTIRPMKLNAWFHMWVELDGAAMTVTRLQAGRSRVQFLSGTRNSLLQNVHTASYSMGFKTKQLRHKANHSFPTSTKVKNEWSYTSTPPICFHVMHRDFFFNIWEILKVHNVFWKHTKRIKYQCRTVLAVIPLLNLQSV